MYDDSDLQRIYNDEYFKGRGTDQKWKRRAEFIIEHFHPKKNIRYRLFLGSDNSILE